MEKRTVAPKPIINSDSVKETAHALGWVG